MSNDELLRAGDQLAAELERLTDEVQNRFIEKYGRVAALANWVDPRLLEAVAQWKQARKASE